MAAAVTEEETWLEERGFPRIVGLAGGAGSGKSTASAALQDIGYRPVSFATPLKKVCFEVFGALGAERRHFYGSQADKEESIEELGGVSGRRIMQLVGTEGYRAAFADVWVRLASASFDPRAFYVIEDVRFLNECRAIQSGGGKVVVLERDENPNATGHGGHSSEAWQQLPADVRWAFPNFEDAVSFRLRFLDIFWRAVRTGRWE